MSNSNVDARERSRRKAQRRRRQQRRSILVILILLAVILVAVAAIITIKKMNSVKKEVTIEAGEAFDPGIFAGNDKIQLEYVSGDYDVTVPGSYEIVLLQDGKKERTVTLVVEDTVAPVVTVQDSVVGIGMEIDPMIFVASSEDATALTGELLTAVDTTQFGIYTVDVVYKDLGGNATETFTVQLIVTDDHEAPKIRCPESVQVNKGDSIIYGDIITVTDNEFDASQLTIQYEGKEKVDTDTVGNYPVKVIATDPVGNQSERTVTIKVILAAYTQESVDALADAVLDKIITDGMTDKEKAKAIYKWVNIDRHIGWKANCVNDSFLQGAYDGFTNGRGDCYIYCMVSKALLDRAGIKNMVIKKIPSDHGNHYWNLVDYGEGWYHFDTTPRKVPHNFCLIGDDELMEYSNANNNSHYYNRDDYPVVNK